jgi:hypothetical protein
MNTLNLILLSGRKYSIEFDSNYIDNIFRNCYLVLLKDYPFLQYNEITLCFEKNNIIYSIKYDTVFKLLFDSNILDYNIILEYVPKFRYYYNNLDYYINYKYENNITIEDIIQNLCRFYMSPSKTSEFKKILKLYDNTSNYLYYECIINTSVISNYNIQFDEIEYYYSHDIIKFNNYNNSNLDILDIIFILEIEDN